MLTGARLMHGSVPTKSPAPSVSALDRARRFLSGEAAGAQAIAPTRLVASRRRPDSTIHLISVGDDRSERRFYLKTLHLGSGTHSQRRQAIAAEYDTLLRLRESFAGTPHLTVVRPVACFPDDLSLLTEEWPGRPVDTVLGGRRLLPWRHNRKGGQDVCGLAGEWLRLFQSFIAPTARAPFDLAQIFSYCDERLKIIVDSRHGGLDARIASGLTRRLDELARDVGPEELSLVARHNDFRPENMLTDGVRLAVLDFTGVTWGPRLYDFMKFWMKLEDLAAPPFGRVRTARSLQAAFADGYGHRVELRSPLALLIRAAFALDKLSEAVDPDLPRPSLSRRPAMSFWYRLQRRRLLAFVQGEPTI